MGNKLPIAVIGLALLCASQSWAGTAGNGWAQRNGIKPVPKTHYTYCMGGLPKTAYFSSVIVSAPTLNKPDLDAPFGTYLTKTLAVRNNGGMCYASDTMAGAVDGKKQREKELVWEKWKIVETKWKG